MIGNPGRTGCAPLQHIHQTYTVLTDVQPADAQPHHLIFLADPQLIDPHTYPGRPWPLSSITISFTDKYLKRSYKALQRTLSPQTIFFLGDLFDGGREWETTGKGGFKASEERWKSYGTEYWLHEYDRFGRIFFDQDQVTGGVSGHIVQDRKIIASLPGNHDLGFGAGVQKPVRDRFRAFFGDGDRVDVVGNHTFVSLDTVSLSAKGQEGALDVIWKPTTEFLDNVKETKIKAVEHELRLQKSKGELARKHAHEVIHPKDLERQPTEEELARTAKPEFPTVVLSHVPFYRTPRTPCGPLREHYPPSKPGLEVDEQNAIRVAGGFQYQNVLAPDITTTIAEKVGNISYVFSGDDHDYCEVLHRHYPSAGDGIREITVKSMSLAMGVRKPGFLLASLWNPVDGSGRSLGAADEPTLQTHLCLLPDTVGTIIRYGMCLGFTLFVLLIRALVLAARKDEYNPVRSSSPILPTVERSAKSVRNGSTGGRHRAASASSNSVPGADGNKNLSVRSYNARARSVSPAPGGSPNNNNNNNNNNGTADYSYGYGLPPSGLPPHMAPCRPQAPLIDRAGYYGKEKDDREDETDEWGYYPDEKKSVLRMERGERRPRGFLRRVGEEFALGIGWVAAPALVWWWWLMRN